MHVINTYVECFSYFKVYKIKKNVSVRIGSEICRMISEEIDLNVGQLNV